MSGNANDSGGSSPLVPRQLNLASGAILFDETRFRNPAMEFFDPSYWQRQDAVVGSHAGRAAACLFIYYGKKFVLRHYHRGGLVSYFIRDRYWWTGLDNCRPWREWRLLAELYQLGLPVPRPVAARVVRRGLLYSADLITEYLADTRVLADLLMQAPVSAELWQRIGAVLRRFHDNGVYHADLNATNILVGTDGRIFLVDFDKGRRGAIASDRQRANLDRLERSLNKLRLSHDPFYFDASSWNRLLGGYRGEG